MKFLLLLLSAVLGLSAPRAFAQGWELLYDGFDAIASMESKVRNVSEVKETPLFANAPFLLLRKGDKLVKAMKDADGDGGKPVANPDKVDVYVLSDGKYYQRWTNETDGKLSLSAAFHSAENCLLFDWDVNLENARALRKLLPLEYAESLTIGQYQAILKATEEKFPEIKINYESANPGLREDRIMTIANRNFAVFEGLAYDSFRNCIYKYSIRLGPSVFSIHGLNLLQGPRHVERSEFERVDVLGPNGNRGQDVDPQTARVKKAEYDQMILFQQMVTKAIRSTRSNGKNWTN